jgi:flagellar basal-body rod protein FlgG
MRALDTAATGMAAMDLQVQVIAGNIANMSTTGFKSQRAEFQDLLYEHIQRIGAQASDQGNILPVGIDLGSGVKTVGTPRLMTQGTLAQTGNPLDVAIQGDGWFKIQMPDGTYQYTRDGSFQMDAQGQTRPEPAAYCRAISNNQTSILSLKLPISLLRNAPMR